MVLIARRNHLQALSRLLKRYPVVAVLGARQVGKTTLTGELKCPKRKGPMRVIALIDDKAVIRKILTHLGLWAPQMAVGKGPGPPAADPPEASEQIPTYHPVPDIA